MSDQTRRVLTEVHAERIRQDEKWGQQNHPTLWPAGATHDRYRELADDWKARNDDRVRVANAAGLPSDRNCAWDGILLEEVFEALSEVDPSARRAELIQVIAVGVAMIEHIDRESPVSSQDTPPPPRPEPRVWRDRAGDLWRELAVPEPVLVLVERQGESVVAYATKTPKANVERAWGPLTEVLPSVSTDTDGRDR